MFQLAIASALLLGGIEVDVQLLDGTSGEGEFVRLTDQGLEISGVSARTFDLGALLAVTPKQVPEPPDSQAALRIDLVDGSLLLASQYTVSAGKADIALLGGGAITVPSRSIRSVRFKTQNADVARQWDEIAQSELEGDVIVIRKTVEDEDAGTTTYSLDYLEGMLSEVSDSTVAFAFDGERVSIPRAKVEGLIYYHPAGRELPETLCTVVDVAGSRLNAKAVRAEDKSVEVTLVSGPGWTLPLANLRKIDFSAGRVLFLSDLDPSSVEWTAYVGADRTLPSLARLYQPRENSSFGGGKLRLKVNGRMEDFAKGLAIHSRTLMIYRMPTGFRRFQALAGIDEMVRTGGHVRLEIRGDNQVLFDEPISVGDETMSIDLDITGVRRLKVLVDFGDQLDIGDSLHLCNARVTK